MGWQDQWFAAEVASAYELEIVKGYENGKFAPGKAITREEMAVMAFRALQAADLTADKTDKSMPYRDASAISSYAKDAIESLTEAGMVSGKGNNLFAPRSLTTRAEAAQLIYRLFRLNA